MKVGTFCSITHLFCSLTDLFLLFFSFGSKTGSKITKIGQLGMNLRQGLKRGSKIVAGSKKGS